jgi:chromosome segregation ATPase
VWCAQVRDEIANKTRAIVDTEKQLERSRKDLHEMRSKLAPLVKEQLAAEEELRRLRERQENTDKLAEAQAVELETLHANYREEELRKREREAKLLELRKRLNSKDFTAQEQVAEFERLKKEEGRRRDEIEAVRSRVTRV